MEIVRPNADGGLTWRLHYDSYLQGIYLGWTEQLNIAETVYTCILGYSDPISAWIPHMIEYFHGFRYQLQVNVGMVPWLYHGYFIPNSF
jgi:hypothetical protein